MKTKAMSPPERLSPQNRYVLEALQSGRTLTNIIALTTMGIGSLTSRIAELRKAGHPIVDEDREDMRGKRYKAYKLAKKAGA